jgi:hypothetical protein
MRRQAQQTDSICDLARQLAQVIPQLLIVIPTRAKGGTDEEL